MKIIHTGDLHLDSAMKTHLGKSVAKERQEELLQAFEKVIEYANSNNIKVIILAGDVFDDNKTTKGTKTRFLKRIEKNKDIDFIYTVGNHDEDSLDSDLDFPTNLFIGTDSWNKKEYGDVSINYINFNSNSEKILYNTLNLDSKNKNIVVLHGEVTNYSDLGKIQLSKLKNKNIDYLCLGHIHKNSINMLDERGVYVYCGCLEGRGFDEEGEKGFYVIDTDDIKNPKFIVNSKRIVYKFEVSIDGCEHWIDYTDKVKDVLKDIDKKDIVEIIITGHYNVELVKKIDALDKNLNEEFYFGKVKDLSKLEIDPKDYENSPTFKSQYIKMVMESEKYTDDEKKEIIEVGIHAMMGDEF